MQSPFPGMDPYIEEEPHWSAFHPLFVKTIYQILLPCLVDRYQATLNRRRYSLSGSQRAEERQEEYIEIREREDGKLVTVMDVVSPANKTTAEGRQAYLDVRRQGRDDKSNLVEIDLVLQGQPTLDYSRDGLPDWDYAVTVTRSTQPERYEIYTATLQKRLPRFRLPLASNDRDTVLDLQTVFTRCHAEGQYLKRINYCRDPAIPLGEDDLRWLDEVLQGANLRGPLPRHEQIALAAYALWEKEGHPHGWDKEHWFQATAELRRMTNAATRGSMP
jgi:hypothetical protein